MPLNLFFMVVSFCGPINEWQHSRNTSQTKREIRGSSMSGMLPAVQTVLASEIRPQLKGSDVFIRALENEGVEYIFGVPGEENLDLLESLHSSTIQLVVTRH